MCERSLFGQVSADYEYIDLWSSPYTWGGLPPPVAGDFVVITPGQRLLLDNSTEVLKMLLIQGSSYFKILYCSIVELLAVVLYCSAPLADYESQARLHIVKVVIFPF